MTGARRHPPDDHDVAQALIDAYRQGAFPMGDPETGRIHLFNADPRGILPLHETQGLHVPRSLKRVIRQERFALTADTAFADVVAACAPPRDEHDTPWLNPTLIHWATILHHHGHAHSVEAWRTDPETLERRLVGGIYGVSVGAAFIAESMFCHPRPRTADNQRHPLDGTDASKVCLIALVRHLHACRYDLLDTQMTTDHVRRFGGREIPADEFHPLLDHAVRAPDRWRPFPRPPLDYHPPASNHH